VTRRALICIELPPTSRWRVVPDADRVPPGYIAIGAIAIGRSEQPALSCEAEAPAGSTQALRSPPEQQLCSRCPLHARSLTFRGRTIDVGDAASMAPGSDLDKRFERAQIANLLSIYDRLGQRGRRELLDFAERLAPL
jgi:hypothetical protein